jgi:hypothetical protein
MQSTRSRARAFRPCGGVERSVRAVGDETEPGWRCVTLRSARWRGRSAHHTCVRAHGRKSSTMEGMTASAATDRAFQIELIGDMTAAATTINTAPTAVTADLVRMSPPLPGPLNAGASSSHFPDPGADHQHEGWACNSGPTTVQYRRSPPNRTAHTRRHRGPLFLNVGPVTPNLSTTSDKRARDRRRTLFHETVVGPHPPTTRTEYRTSGAVTPRPPSWGRGAQEIAAAIAWW